MNTVKRYAAGDFTHQRHDEIRDILAAAIIVCPLSLLLLMVEVLPSNANYADD